MLSEPRLHDGRSRARGLFRAEVSATESVLMPSLGWGQSVGVDSGLLQAHVAAASALLRWGWCSRLEWELLKVLDQNRFQNSQGLQRVLWPPDSRATKEPLALSGTDPQLRGPQ